LREILEDESVSEKKLWVKKASRVPIYNLSAVVTWFILFIASNDCEVDANEPGLIVRGRSGVTPLLDIRNWRKRDYLTVEHVAPQRPGANWRNEIYEDPDTVATIGNLILLPSQENSIVANRSWEHKRALYAVMSSPTNESYDQAIQRCKKLGLNPSVKATDILNASSFLPLCKSLAQKEDDWSVDFIHKRSERLASLAWDVLAPHLDL